MTASFITVTVMLTVLCLLVIPLALAAAVGPPDASCPVWTTPLNDTCKCADDLKGIVSCEDGRGVQSIKKCFCMTTYSTDNSTVVASCLYECDLAYPTVYSPDDTGVCNAFMRTGTMCGECLPTYGLPAYSYSIHCVKCTEYRFNWIKYIAVAYVPLTIFCFMVILLRVAGTSGYLLGYVTVCQMVSLKSLFTLIFNVAIQRDRHTIVMVYSVLLPIWNLDFFRSLYPPFCLSPHLTILQVQVLDYIIAVYPMVLVLLSYALVKLHDCFLLVVYICQPFYRCFLVFRKKFDIKTSLIESFATFYLLSYVKILNTSADILTPTEFFSMNGTSSGPYYYFNGSVPYLGKEHLPYALLAVTLLGVFNILPLLLLLLYPCLCFQNCLNKTRCSCHALHVFMDALLGSFTHRPRERRYFGVCYLILRLVHVFGFAIMNPIMYSTLLSYSLVVVLLSLAAIRPHRNKYLTLIDGVLFSALLHSTLMLIFLRDGLMVNPEWTHKTRKMYNTTGLASISIIPLYGLLLVIRKIVPWSCAQAMLTKLLHVRAQANTKVEPSLPHRMEHEERQRLLH